MTAAEIRAQFPPWVRVICYDETYAKPTVAWIRDKFWPWHQKRRFDLGLHKHDRRNDCDNHMRSFAQSAADCHALTVGDVLTPEGLAIGEFMYVGTTHVKGPHGINVSFTDDGKVFWEPQTGQRLALTPLEEMSVFDIRF